MDCLGARHDEPNPAQDHETTTFTLHRAPNLISKPISKDAHPRPFRSLTTVLDSPIQWSLTAFVYWEGQINAEKECLGSELWGTSERSSLLFNSNHVNASCFLPWVLIASLFLLYRQFYLELFRAQRGHDSLFALLHSPQFPYWWEITNEWR